MSLFHRCFSKHFASKNQLPGLSVSGTLLVENGLMMSCRYDQWKIIFNIDVSEQAQGIVFSLKVSALVALIYFNNLFILPIIRKNIHKYLGLLLDSEHDFLDHVNEKIKKATTRVSVIRKMKLLLRSSLLTIYKSSRLRRCNL